MDIEPTEAAVDTSVDTDDLDTFSNTLFNRKEEDKAAPTDPVVEDETDEDEPETKAEDAPDGDAEPEVEDKPKKVNRVQERINQLVTERENEKRRADELEQRLKSLEVKQEPVKAVPTSVVDDGPSPDDKTPDGEDKYPLGEFDPTYIRDMARHTIDKEWNLRKEQEAQQTAQREEQRVRDQLQVNWIDKVTTVQDTHEDFIEKTLELESTFEGLDPQYSDYLVQTIKSLDHGPEVLYYFANNLDEAKKFVRMGPNAATLALGEYNAMFKGSTRKEAKVSNAPVPPQLNKGSKTRTVVAADTDDLDAFTALLFKGKR